MRIPKCRYTSMQIRYVDQLTANAEWGLHACGAACVLMILKSLTQFKGGLDDLIQELQNKDGFLLGVGWKHDALLEVLKDQGLQGQIERSLDADRLADLLERNYLVILSVKSRISGGGHLILVGREKDGGIKVNDPYNLDQQGGAYRTTLGELSLVSNNKGISIEIPRPSLINAIQQLIAYEPEGFELYDYRKET